MARVDLDMTGFEELKRAVLVKAQEIPLAIGVDAEATAPRDTGALALSVAVDQVADTRWRVSAWGGAGGRHYAAYVEFGTSRMRPQPFLKPACYRARAL